MLPGRTPTLLGMSLSSIAANIHRMTESGPFVFTGLLYWWSLQSSFSAKPPGNLNQSTFKIFESYLETILSPQNWVNFLQNFWDQNTGLKLTGTVANWHWLNSVRFLKRNLKPKPNSVRFLCEPGNLTSKNTSMDLDLPFPPVEISTQHPILLLRTPALTYSKDNRH